MRDVIARLLGSPMGWLIAAGLVAGLICGLPSDALSTSPSCNDEAAAAKIHRGDLDGDGRPDCWTRCWDGGSGFGGQFLVLRPRCGDRSVEFDTHSSFGAFVSRHTVPGVDPAMRRGIAELLFGPGALRRRTDAAPHDAPMIDGSLMWLLEPRLTLDRGIGPFAKLTSFIPRWRPGPVVMPATQVVVEGDALIAYMGHNHARVALTRAARCGGLDVFTTAHGIAVQRPGGAEHAWVHITTPARKLRWPSVGSVRCRGDLVEARIDIRDGPPRQIVIDPIHGLLGVLGPQAAPGAKAKATLAAHATWRHRFDLDGDGAADSIESTYSGGAHCCYRLTVLTSGDGQRHPLPFDLDGGVMSTTGADGQPTVFQVRDATGDGVADLVLTVATYNGAPGPIPAAWTARFGFTGHRVAVSLVGGRLTVEDIDPPVARGASSTGR